MSKLLFLGISLGCSLFLSSCTVEITPKPALSQTPIADQLPLRVGFYHGDRFKRHHVIAQDGVAYNFFLAEASAQLAQTVLKSMFRNVVLVNGKSAASDNLDGTLIVDIEAFQSPIENNSLTINQADIAYVFLLFDEHDQPVDILKIKGKGTTNARFLLHSALQDAAALAMKDAMAQFMVDFAKHPGFKRWLQSHGAMPDKTDGSRYEK